MLMAFFGCISATAERVAPTLPDFVQLESGKNYYLYNVGTGKFLTYNSGVKVAEVGAPTTITSSGSYYIISFSGTDYYLYSSSNTSITRFNKNETYAKHENYAKFSLNSIDNQSYTIQRYYSADTMYVGCSADATDLAIYPELSDDNNIEWKLIDGEKGDMYCARLRLYNALEAMSGTTYNIDKFEAIYADEASTVDAINNAAKILSDGLSLSSNYVFPSTNDFPILFERSTDYNWKLSSGGYFSIESLKGGTLTATVVVDGDATLHFDLYIEKYYSYITIVVDGKEMQLDCNFTESVEKRFFYELKAGKHVVEWIVKDRSTQKCCRVSNISVERTPTVTVNLLEPGSLGTEILYNVNHLKDVRKLVINGSMNSDDWDKIDMIGGNLYTLDISGTDVNTITEKRFYNWPYLHAIKLPAGLTTIEENAFSYSDIDSINFPSSLQRIGNYALSSTNIRKAILPERCTAIGQGVFSGCLFLEKAKLSDSIGYIPLGLFSNCRYLRSFDFPPLLSSIGDDAFYECISYRIPKFPETLIVIGSYSFFDCFGTDSLIIPKKVYAIGERAFSDNNYKYVELPVAYYKIKTPFLPSTIKTIRLNCPTVVLKDDVAIGVELSNVTLQVPSHLVNSYKLDDYWYNAAAIEGFDTDEIDYWQIQRELVLNARDRLKGTPSIDILPGGSLKINGNDGMPINDLTVHRNKNSYKYGQIFSNADGVTVNGNLRLDYYLGTANKWYYISLPFDVKVSDIISTDFLTAGKRAIRYYDGARRAEQGASGNWINASEDDIIPAGTGFIMQSNYASWWRFPSQENESKQYMTSYKMFAKALQANVSENASDKGWNLVGNPYQCYYNIHKLNFTAPITVRNVSNNTYESYSVIDDDYAIEPNEAFFVQCPDGVTEISFPLDGRQLSSVIEDANASKPHGAQERSSRFLMDITVSNGKISDRTRIVLNDKATMDYEMNCDASKFMSESADVPQIFSHDGANTMYAINERPEADGKVLLGFTTMENGVFSISLTRNNVENVFLVDNEMGQTVDLTAGSYEFTAEAGNYMNRFELRLNSTPTGIEEIANSSDTTTFRVVEGGIVVNGYAEVFNMAGQKVAEGSGTLPMANGTYVLKTNGKSVKVIVK